MRLIPRRRPFPYIAGHIVSTIGADAVGKRTHGCGITVFFQHHPALRRVGFCDVDGRIPSMKKTENPFSPFASIVNRPHPYFSDLTVNPDYRRKGIASALVGEGERRAKDMQCQEMYLGVSSANTAALSLYSNMGYEIIVPTGDILEFVKRQEGVRMLRRTLD